MELALAIVALILAGIDQINARGRSLTCWAVIALTAIFLLPALR